VWAQGRVRGTLALTPTLSPEEREHPLASLESSFVFGAIAAASAFVEKVVRQAAASASPKRGERFSLSWGRGPG
jgi:hypothetical protein